MRHKATRQYIAVFVTTLLLLGMTFLNAQSQALGALRVSFIDVGQGDSALLQDANGFDVLIDGGVAAAGPTVVAYLRQQGIDDIDVLVASHGDSDHIGGLIRVLEAVDIPIEAVVVNGYDHTSVTWANFLSAAAARGLTPTVAQFPDEFLWGEMVVHVLNPISELSDPETNDASLVLLVDHGAMNFLFTGDIDSSIEAQVVARGTPVSAEVLKVAHHGSAYSSSAGFVQAVGAQESIISVGANSYGHPNADTLQRLSSAGSGVWRTDENGDIVIDSDGVSIAIVSEQATVLMYLPVLVYVTPVVIETTPPPVYTTGNIVIQSVFADGSGTNEPDEYVEIRNADSHAINVQNWTLRDNANHVYTFPSFLMQPGQVCRVYTNQDRPETCGFNYRSGSAIWNNGGDCAYLKNSVGQEVNNRCY